ncbi:MAG: hypothetical protein WBI50_04525, partial [Acetomicrobium sp.]
HLPLLMTIATSYINKDTFSANLPLCNLSYCRRILTKGYIFLISLTVRLTVRLNEWTQDMDLKGGA